MKNLITATACTVLLLVLLSQFVHQQVLLMQTQAATHAVETFCQMEEEEPSFSSCESWLKERISGILHCGREEICVFREENKREKRIDYVVEFPIKKILAAPEFWGVKDNEGIYRIEREAADESFFDNHGHDSADGTVPVL